MISKDKLRENVNKVKSETKDALQTVIDELNQGQRKKIVKNEIVKNEKVKELLDRYGVDY